MASSAARPLQDQKALVTGGSGPLVSNSLFSVEGHLVRATFNG
jgi:hypothetical protein